VSALAEFLVESGVRTIDQVTDQASGLRRLFEKRSTPLIAFASARAHAQAGKRMDDRVRLMMQFADDYVNAGSSVTILDEHPAPGGIARAYGVESRKDLKHVLHGDYALDEVMFSPLPGVTVIPAPRVAGMEFSLADEASLAGNLTLLRNRSDCLMIDCVHRTQQALSPIAHYADQLLVTVSAIGDELMQSYALIKRITLESATLAISIIVTHAADAAQARALFEKLRRVALDHLGVSLHYQGAAMTPGVRRLSLLPSVGAAVPSGDVQSDYPAGPESGSQLSNQSGTGPGAGAAFSRF
jgi:flagellar biosynthesis protein FlhG